MTHKIYSKIAVLACSLVVAACGGGGGGAADSGPDTNIPAGNSPPSITGAAPGTVAVGGEYKFTPNASDPDGDSLSFSVQNQPSWATFDGATGELAGTPDTGDEGTYSNIAIGASDGTVTTMMASFSVQVNPNVAPIISGTPATLVTVGSAYSFQPVVVDPDSDTLSFAVENLPAWASFNIATGRISGTPESDHIGTHDGIIILVSDDYNTSEMQAFAIEVIAFSPSNNPPVITGVPAPVVVAGTPYQFIPTVFDPDGDDVSFTLENQPVWMTLDASTGVLGGTPSIANAGEYSNIILTVSDGNASTSLPAFTITVSTGNLPNARPVIVGTPASSVVAGTLYRFTPLATDAEGDPLSFSIQNMPVWATFSSVSGELTGTPAAGDVGTYSNVLISVSDGNQSAALPPFSITVSTSNSAPQISGSPNLEVAVGDAYRFTPTASDPEDDTLTFSISNAPSWTDFDTTTGQLSGTPQQSDIGTYSSIVISVSDGTESVSLAAFTITVSGGNSAPTISGSPATELTVGETYSFTPVGDDADGDTLTYAIVNRPSWAAFDTATGTLSGIAESADVGAYNNITISVSDGTTQTALPAFAITVNDVTLGTVTISWTPPTQNEDGSTLTDLSGYRFYYGVASGNYTSEVDVDVAGLSTFMIENLVPGEYFFAMTSINGSGQESGFSDEISTVVTSN